MFTKLATLRTIDESGAVLIVRLPDADTAERVAHAAIEGGFRALEITLSIPGAVDLIHRLAAQYTSEGVAVGAGTVLDGHAAYECIRAGATFLVSPQLNPEMIRVANRYQVPDDQRGVHPDRDTRDGRGGCGHRQAVPDRERGHPVRQGRARAAGAPADHARRRRDDRERQGVVRGGRRRRRCGQRRHQGVAT